VSASEGRFEAVRSGRLTGFVGREYELGLLIERWHLAQDGEGQVVLRGQHRDDRQIYRAADCRLDARLW
jgi:hypothetical protein